MNKKVLIKDIVIPAGTIFHKAPIKTVRHFDNWYNTIIGLSKNTYGTLTYSLDTDEEELKQYFVDVTE